VRWKGLFCVHELSLSDIRVLRRKTADSFP